MINQSITRKNSEDYSRMSPGRRRRRGVGRWAVVAVLTVVIGGGIALLTANRNTVAVSGSKESAPAAIASAQDEAKEAANVAEIKSILAQVSKHYLVTSDEVPALATVVDAEKLTETQPFFANAKNGDKLLIFSKTQQAILYSPSRNIVVNVGPIQGEAEAVIRDGEKASTNKNK